MTVDFDPLADDWNQDPYPIYRELRDHAPVHYARGSEQFVLTRFDDVEYALETPEIFSSKMDRSRISAESTRGPAGEARFAGRTVWRMGARGLGGKRSRHLIGEDGETHATMRAIVDRGFTPRRLARWEARAQELAAAAVAGFRSNARFDVVADLAVPIPITIIAEMLGVENDRLADFKSWSDTLMSAATGSSRETDGGRALIGALGDLRSYLRPILRARRAEPSDDLISVLVATEGGSDLTDLEIHLFIVLLLMAGNETTSQLIGSTVDALLRHPADLARVEADPSLVPEVLEEVLRWECPAQMLPRQAAEDVEMHGIKIPKGAQVALMIGAANRDERRYPDPDRFDISRADKGHLAFSAGPHYCLGASLARLEARAAIDALLPELGRWERVDETREYVNSFVVRGLTRLELRARR